MQAVIHSFRVVLRQSTPSCRASSQCSKNRRWTRPSLAERMHHVDLAIALRAFLDEVCVVGGNHVGVSKHAERVRQLRLDSVGSAERVLPLEASTRRN